jgi:hypothetical protein
MDEDFKALTEKLQKQVKENEKEAIGNLLKHSIKSCYLKEKGRIFERTLEKVKGERAKRS